jgi:hypothetical protein
MVAETNGPVAGSVLRGLAALVVVGAMAGSISCAHRGLEPAEASAASAPGPGADSGGRQVLLRVRYRGLDGRGRIRLTVRLSGDAFQLAGADAFGRPLWTLSGRGGSTLLLDHRRREACEMRGEVAVPAIALSDLPVAMLPRVLLGELPFVLPAGRQPPEIDFTDASGRRWTARLTGDGRPERWTLWADDRPLVWWQAMEQGAVLSHLDGAQVLWTVIADEALAGPVEALEIPDGYASGNCDEQGLS